MRARSFVPFASALGSVAIVLVACVSDTKTPTSSTSDASTTEDGAVVQQDANATDAPVEEDAGACKVPTANGIQCFGEPRCKAIFEACCVSLGGVPPTLTGACVPKGDAALKTCQDAKAVLWECDRSKDCPSAGAKCCVPNVFKIVDADACPMKIDIDDQSGPPQDGKATRCVQGSGCGPSEVTACETNAECEAGKSCVPAMLQGKMFGLCVAR
ncbi:MAG: hypothetical protein U0174_03935 [Polyangiaceae bacterium]